MYIIGVGRFLTDICNPNLVFHSRESIWYFQNRRRPAGKMLQAGIDSSRVSRQTERGEGGERGAQCSLAVILLFPLQFLSSLISSISRLGIGLVHLHWDLSPIAGPAQHSLASSSNLCRVTRGGPAGWPRDRSPSPTSHQASLFLSVSGHPGVPTSSAAAEYRQRI